jgi:alpha-tubulin suppressor-like RCC1 family protein
MTKRSILLFTVAVLVAACSSNKTGETSGSTSGQGGDDVSSSTTSGSGGDWTESDECALGTDACSDDATCTDTPNFYECECKPGYQGDGYDCSDINECAQGIHDCGDNASCTNEEGSHSCTCDPGFVGDGKTCDANYTRVTTGYHHACAIREDSTAWCWGAGGNGRLGNDSSADKAQVSAVIGTGWSGLVAGNASTCGIKTDGTLWCWGRGNEGQLGLDSTTTYDTPQHVGGESDWEKLTLGAYHVCGLRKGGKLYCWGGNNYTQVGNDSSSKTLQPVAIEPNSTFSAVALGYYHSCAVNTDGSLWCWGRNNDGQLGIGSSNGNFGLPQQVGSEMDWDRVTLGEAYSCATKTDGALWCWGRGAEGQLGYGDTSEKTTPQAVDVGNAYAHIAGGRQTMCGLRKNDGSLWCWGKGGNGQLGDAPARNLAPVELWDHKDWQQLEVGVHHICGLRSDNRISCWGNNRYGQTGSGEFGQALSPRSVKTGAASWAANDLSNDTSLALGQDGTLWSWARNFYGQLGLGDESNRRAPAQIGQETSWIAAKTAINQSCGLQTTGQETTLWCWGRNSNGVLGTGAPGNAIEMSPVQVGSDTDWMRLTTRWYHACGLKAGRELFCWGHNNYNQVAEGSTSARYTPEQVSPGALFDQVAAGNSYTCAVKSDGTLWCWGKNNRGQLGVGDQAKRTTPTPVGTDTTWSQVATHYEHSCGLKTDNSLWCWGYNNYGQLGFGDKNARPTPEKVAAASWSQISVARYHSCGVQTDGTLWCWGNGGWGRLGLGNTSSHTSPQQVGADNTWADVTVGHEHNCARKTTGNLFCWGSNHFGRTGHDDAWTAEPVVILEP